MLSNITFHHIGIATASIKKCIEVYKEIGYISEQITNEPSQNVKIVFLKKDGQPLIELIEPLNDNSPVSRFVNNFGTIPYHICYEVQDIKGAILEFEFLKYRLLFEPIISEAMNNGLFCYLFSNDLGLVELYQAVNK